MPVASDTDKRPGRPPLYPDGIARLQLTVSPATKEALREYAAERGISMNQAVEDMLSERLNTPPKR